MNYSLAVGESKSGYVLYKNRLEYRTTDAELFQGTVQTVHRCQKCKYFTRSIFCFQNHMDRHKILERKFFCHDSIPEEYFCTECNFSTHLKAYFKEHITDYHGLKRENETKLVLKTYKCRKCAFWTFSCLVLLKHQMNGKCRHRKDVMFNNYICHHCNYGTKYECYLKIHILYKHTPSDRIQWFECDKCNYKAKMKSDLNIHIRRRHTSLENVKWHESSHCDKKGKSLPTMRRHTYQKQTVKTKLFCCEYCQYTTTVSSNFKYHLYKKHSCNVNIKFYHCDQCDYKTVNSSNLKHHRVSNHKTDDLQDRRCKFCDFKSKWPGNLSVHIRRKHKRFESCEWLSCDQCEYKSKIPSDMRFHKLHRHTSEMKRFKCDQCGYMSTLKTNLNRHILCRHTADEDVNWFGCNQCEYKSKTKSDLYKHLRIHSDKCKENEVTFVKIETK